MNRLSFAAIALVLFAATSPVIAQSAAGTNPKARCAELVAFWDRHSGGKSEGSGGAEMARKGAVADCDAGRYDRGIRSMEDLLKRNGYTVPPA